MTPRDLPFLDRLEHVGPSDPVFDLLALLGPVVIALIALLGRSTLTETIAAAYVVAFPAALARKYWRTRHSEPTSE